MAILLKLLGTGRTKPSVDFEKKLHLSLDLSLDTITSNVVCGMFRVPFMVQFKYTIFVTCIPYTFFPP